MKTSKFLLIKFVILLLLWIALYYIAVFNFITFNTSIGLCAITFLILVVIPRPLTNVEKRQYLVQQASKGFKDACKRIVDYQYRPTGIFDKNDLSKAFGLKRLPKPEYVSGFESQDVYTFHIKENFQMKVSIVSGMMNTGGGMTYQTFEFSGYEFGTCKLYEGEIECAKFNYKHRFIHWLTEEFEDATGFINKSEYIENHLDVEDRIINAWVKQAMAKN